MKNKTEQQIVWPVAFMLLMTSMLTIMRLSSEWFWTWLSIMVMFFSMIALSNIAHSGDDDNK